MQDRVISIENTSDSFFPIRGSKVGNIKWGVINYMLIVPEPLVPYVNGEKVDDEYILCEGDKLDLVREKNSSPSPSRNTRNNRKGEKMSLDILEKILEMTKKDLIEWEGDYETFEEDLRLKYLNLYKKYSITGDIPLYYLRRVEGTFKNVSLSIEGIRLNLNLHHGKYVDKFNPYYNYNFDEIIISGDRLYHGFKEMSFVNNQFKNSLIKTIEEKIRKRETEIFNRRGEEIFKEVFKNK